MKLFVLILSRIQVLEDLIADLAANGVRGATILESTGMAKILCKNPASHDGYSFLDALKSVLEPVSEETSKTVLIVTKDEDIPKIKESIARVVGDITQPNTGITFSIPLDFIEGINL